MNHSNKTDYKILGSSEYVVSFSNTVEGEPKKPSSLTINPYKNIASASRGRPNELNTMFSQDNLTKNYTSETKAMHQWPQPDNVRRLDFMQNKY